MVVLRRGWEEVVRLRMREGGAGEAAQRLGVGGAVVRTRWWCGAEAGRRWCGDGCVEEAVVWQRRGGGGGGVAVRR